ncbi:MAG: replication protein RepA [Burkholderia sp.]
MQIEQEEARKAGALGFMARTLAQVTLPHTNPDTLYYERNSGKLSLAVRGHKSYGVPYGTIPRVVLAWICTEAVQTKSPILELGRSAADFSRKLEMHYNGRDLARLKKQCLALARAIISIDSHDMATDALAFEDIKIASRGFVFWSEKHLEQPSLWESTLTLTDDFFKAATTHPVPIDLRAYHALSKSPLGMDIYTWLVYRMFVLRVSGHAAAMVPWVGLKAQFGGNYADDAKGLSNFKVKFRARMREVFLFYPEAEDHIEEVGEHLRLTPCRLHIRHNKGARLSRLDVL